VRTQVTGYLVAMGARQRPPRPELQIEERGTPPFPDATWIAGRWDWNEPRWAWTWVAGRWTDSTRFGNTGGDVVVGGPVTPPVLVPSGGTTVVVPPVGIGVGVRIEPVRVRREPPPPRKPVREHRKDEPKR
jgi:hypothetical protein